MHIQQAFSWPIRTLQNAYAPRPAMTWAVTGLFQVPSLSIVYGPPGSFKSMLLADMLACVAAGIPWLAPLPFTSNKTLGLPTLAGPALWLDFDNGPRRTDDRFEAIGRAYKLDPAVPLSYVSMPPGGLFMDKRQHAEALTMMIMQQNARLVVIDNLGVISGDAEEISAEMVPVMSNLRYVCEWANCALIVIHHQRKSNGSKGREGDTLRGHSSIEAALDLALLVEREAHTPDIKLRSTKTRGADVTERTAVFAYQHKAGTLDLAEARFYGVDSAVVHPLAQLPDEIINLLTVNGPLNQSQVVAEMYGLDPSYTRAKVLEELKRLLNTGQINDTPGRSKNARIYSV